MIHPIGVKEWNTFKHRYQTKSSCNIQSYDIPALCNKSLGNSRMVVAGSQDAREAPAIGVPMFGSLPVLFRDNGSLQVRSVHCGQIKTEQSPEIGQTPAISMRPCHSTMFPEAMGSSHYLRETLRWEGERVHGGFGPVMPNLRRYEV